MEILKSIKIKNVESLLFKDKINDRRCGEVADDSKLLRRTSKPRRRSIVYIKDEIQINNVESENA